MKTDYMHINMKMIMRVIWSDGEVTKSLRCFELRLLRRVDRALVIMMVMIIIVMIMMIMVVMVMMRIIAQTGGPGPGYNDGDLIIISR